MPSMAARALRGPLIVLLALVLGGGASVLCLAADLCAHGGPRVASEASGPRGAEESTEESPGASCHAVEASGDRTADRPELVISDDAGDCCSLRAERLDARTGSRDRLARWSAAPSNVAVAAPAGGAVVRRAEPGIPRAEGGSRPGPRPPAFTLYGALLL
jgi:hypothetical protein